MSLTTKDLIAQHNLTGDEYKKIIEILGREPNLTELGMFSVMWSEHCSYKSSRVHLKKLPTTGPRVVQGPGENAGAVDIGAFARVVSFDPERMDGARAGRAESFPAQEIFLWTELAKGKDTQRREPLSQRSNRFGNGHCVAEHIREGGSDVHE